MSDSDKLQLTDAQLAEAIIRCRVLSPGQLKAALDYQASVGGRLLAVLRKLGLVREEILQAFLDSLARGEDFDGTTFGQNDAELAPPDFDVDKLRVHRKLLEKVPAEIVARYQMLFFFPPPGTRAILMSAGTVLGETGLRKLQQLLGVEIREIELTEEERRAFLPGGSGKPPPRRGGKNRGSRKKKPAAEESGIGDEESRDFGRPQGFEGAPRRRSTVGGEFGDVDEATLVNALAQLLIKKGMIEADEVKVEIRLLKHSKSAELAH